MGDVAAMAKGALSLLTNPELHNTFKENAYEHAKSFDLNRVISSYEGLYAKAVG